MRLVDLTSKLSAKLAVDAVQIFWHQARIPIPEMSRQAGTSRK